MHSKKISNDKNYFNFLFNYFAIIVNVYLSINNIFFIILCYRVEEKSINQFIDVIYG